jgi:hypothetical protein
MARVLKQDTASIGALGDWEHTPVGAVGRVTRQSDGLLIFQF